MVDAGEVIAIFSGLATGLPYLMRLSAHTDKPSGVSAFVYMLWTSGFLAPALYFECHPTGSRMHSHHHQVTDIPVYPKVIATVFWVLSALCYLCLVKDRLILSKKSDGTPQPLKTKAIITAKTVAPFLCVVAALFAVAGLLQSIIVRKSSYLHALFFLSLVLDVGYLAGWTLAFVYHRHLLSDVHCDFHLLPVCIQTLGLFLSCVNLTIMYTVVDWTGMITVAVLGGVNIIFLCLRMLPSKQEHSYKPVDIELDDARDFEVE